MAIASRRAETVWEGTLAGGDGTIILGSGATPPLPVTWATRTEDPSGRTSPEELIAAAHASCFSMALALRFGENRVRVDSTTISATVTLDDVDGLPTITTSAIEVIVSAPDLQDGRLQTIVAEAAELCPVSRLCAGATITVDARLA